MDTDEEVTKMVEKMKEIGTANADGSVDVPFGELFNQTQDILEALNGTLRAAKKAKIIDFKGQMLLKGVNDAVIVKLLPTEK